VPHQKLQLRLSLSSCIWPLDGIFLKRWPLLLWLLYFFASAGEQTRNLLVYWIDVLTLSVVRSNVVMLNVLASFDTHPENQQIDDWIIFIKLQNLTNCFDEKRRVTKYSSSWKPWVQILFKGSDISIQIILDCWQFLMCVRGIK